MTNAPSDKTPERQLLPIRLRATAQHIRAVAAYSNLGADADFIEAAADVLSHLLASAPQEQVAQDGVIDIVFDGPPKGADELDIETKHVWNELTFIANEIDEIGEALQTTNALRSQRLVALAQKLADVRPKLQALREKP